MPELSLLRGRLARVSVPSFVLITGSEGLLAERALASKTPSDIPLRVVLALDPLLTLRGPFALHPTMVRVALEALPDDAVRPRMLALEARGRLRQARQSRPAQSEPVRSRGT